MDYKISDICSNLSIGKSTIYKRIDTLKKNIPDTDWRNNDYFYYTDNNKLFITEKGFQYIKDCKLNSSKSNLSITPKDISIFLNSVEDVYKKRIEYLEKENSRLLDIIALKEKKELAKDINYIGNNDTVSFWDKLFNKFKK